MLGGLSLAALGATAISLAEEVGKFLVRVMLLFALLAILWPLLPADPFRQHLLDLAAALEPYVHWINLVIPVDTVVGCAAFYAAWRYAYAVYRRVSRVAFDGSTDVVLSS